MTSRPLSPHLQIYRPQLTSVLSITHRATGAFLGLGTLALLYWLMAAAVGPDAYAVSRAVLGSVPGQLLLAAWSFSFYFHLCNGIRHLCWDAGWGFENRSTCVSGYTVVIVALVCTGLTWGCVLARIGGGA